MENLQFNFAIPITRAYRKADGSLWIEGIASSTEIDSYETIFNENCQEGFALDISENADTEEPVKIESEHNGSEDSMNNLGTVRTAFVTKDKELYIQALLDSENPKAVYYHRVLTDPDPKLGRPKKLGLSINGYVVDAHWEYNENLKKEVRVFDRVRLEKIGIVRSPANPSTWVTKLVRSTDWTSAKKEYEMTDEPVTAVVEEAVITTEEVATEVRSDETVVSETVNRTDYYKSMTALEVLEDLVCAMGCLESLIKDEKWMAEWSDRPADVATAKAALSTLSTALPQVQQLLTESALPEGETMSEERALDSSNSQAMVVEDVSDEITNLDATRSEEAPVTVLDETVTTEVDVKAEILSALEATLTEFRSAIETSIKSTSDKIEELARSLETAKTEKEELVARMVKLEASPVSLPGGQIVNPESIERALTSDEQAMESLKNEIARAKEKRDAHAMLRLILMKDLQK